MSGMQAGERPPGFEPFRFSSPFLDLIGPLFSMPNDAGLTIGMHIEERHCNRRGTVHGGILTSLADVALGYSAGHGKSAVRLTTIALNIEFLEPGTLGQWVEWVGSVTKFGRSIAHANCTVTSDSLRLARATGVFKVLHIRHEMTDVVHRGPGSDGRLDRAR